MSLQDLINAAATVNNVSLSSVDDGKKVERYKGSKLLELDAEQKARIGVKVERKSVLQKNCKISGYKGKIGFRDHTLYRNGKTVSSRRYVQKSDCGSELLVCVGDREYWFQGELRQVVDVDLKIRKVGSDLRSLMKKSRMLMYSGVACCLVCRTSDFVRKVYASKKRGAEVLYHECTCCGSSTKHDQV